MDHDVLQKIIHDKGVRKNLAMKSHYWFFHIYLSHYVKFKTAEFHKEIFNITENENIKDAVIVSFRGSAKSTIMTLSYPLWAMLGTPQKKCIVVASLTQNQSKTLLYQIKNELESNSLLIEDFGPFAEENDAWRADSLIIGPYGTRILAISANESIRGLRHGAYRPDLIICDDVEDINTVKSQEGRDKTYQWFTGELIPMGDLSTKVVVIGNLLHEDSLIMRLKGQGAKTKNRIFKSYPLITDNESIIWLGKYPDQESIDQERNRVGHIAFQREYLLTIVPDNDVVVRPEWICYYDELPNLQQNDFRYLAFSVDLAISEKQTADYTAIVSGYVFGIDKDTKIYISPFPINQRMDFPKTINTIISENLKHSDKLCKWFVEDVAYQAAVIQELNQHGLQVQGVKLLGADKRARISQTTSWIQNGRVLFPRKGVERLISQLVSFGVERYDDLADAFSMLVLQIIKFNPKKARVFGPDSEAYRFFHKL